MKHHQVEKKSVPRETFDVVDDLYQKYSTKLGQYIEKLFWWNGKVNLISRELTQEELALHIKHSLLPLGLFDIRPGQKLLDAGTGGGLPGIPLAICSPQVKIDLNDISTKKILALKDIGRKLSLSNVACRAGDIAKLNIDNYHFIISKHAFKIPDIIKPLSTLDKYKVILYKGIDIGKELSQLKTPHKIVQYDIATQTDEEFYQGKSIVLISPGK